MRDPFKTSDRQIPSCQGHLQWDGKQEQGNGKEIKALLLTINWKMSCSLL